MKERQHDSLVVTHALEVGERLPMTASASRNVIVGSCRRPASTRFSSKRASSPSSGAMRAAEAASSQGLRLDEVAVLRENRGQLDLRRWARTAARRQKLDRLAEQRARGPTVAASLRPLGARKQVVGCALSECVGGLAEPVRAPRGSDRPPRGGSRRVRRTRSARLHGTGASPRTARGARREPPSAALHKPCPGSGGAGSGTPRRRRPAAAQVGLNPCGQRRSGGRRPPSPRVRVQRPRPGGRPGPRRSRVQARHALRNRADRAALPAEHGSSAARRRPLAHAQRASRPSPRRRVGCRPPTRGSGRAAQRGSARAAGGTRLACARRPERVVRGGRCSRSSFPPPQAGRWSRARASRRERSRIGASRLRSATCSTTSRNAGSPHWTSSNTTTSGRWVTCASRSTKGQAISSGEPRRLAVAQDRPEPRGDLGSSFRRQGLHHDLGHGPVADALAVRQATAPCDGGVVERPKGTRRRAGLADACGAENREELAGALADDVGEGVVEQLPLPLAADHRRASALRASQPWSRPAGTLAAARTSLSPRPAPPGRRPDRLANEPESLFADEDYRRRRGLLEPCGDVHRVAGRDPLFGAGDDLAGVDADAELEPSAVALLELGVQLGEAVAEAPPRPAMRAGRRPRAPSARRTPP